MQKIKKLLSAVLAVILSFSVVMSVTGQNAKGCSHDSIF